MKKTILFFIVISFAVLWLWFKWPTIIPNEYTDAKTESPHAIEINEFAKSRNASYQLAKDLAKKAKSGDPESKIKLGNHLVAISDMGLLSDWIVASIIYLDVLPYRAIPENINAEIHDKLLHLPSFLHHEFELISKDSSDKVRDECIWLNDFFNRAFSLKTKDDQLEIMMNELESRADRGIASEDYQIRKFYSSFPNLRPVAKLYLKLRTAKPSVLNDPS